MASSEVRLEDSVAAEKSLADLMAEVDVIMAHAWMVRTFVKHSEEVEDFPELMELVRVTFDTARALESQREDPGAVLRMLRKKLPKMKAAAARFRIDAPKASAHTNFVQAVISYDGCVAALDKALKDAAKLQAIEKSPPGHLADE